MGDGVRVESHPPERRRRSTVLAVHGSCCCCCLHAVGGLAGAAFGSLRRNAPDPLTLTCDASIRAEEESRQASLIAAKVYWMVLGLTVLGCAGASALLSWSEPLVGLFLLVFFLPGAQLMASLVAWTWIRRHPPARKAECLARLGKITIWGFVGALAGVLGMLISVFTMSMLK